MMAWSREPLRVMGVLEVVEPASQNRVQTGNDLVKALASGPFRLGPDLVFELVQALLADVPPFALEAVAKEAEAPALFPAVPDMGLIRMQAEAVLRYPRADERKGSSSGRR